MKRAGIVALVVALCISGCANASEEVSITSESVMSSVVEEGSSTSMVISALEGARCDAALGFVRASKLSLDVESTKEACTVNAKLETPSVLAVQKRLCTSDTFKQEYAVTKDQEGCMYGYATNAILELRDDDFDTVELSVTGNTSDSAEQQLVTAVDNAMQKALSGFLLTELYSGDGTVLPQEPLPSNNLQDFVAVFGKNKILVSNVQVVVGEEAKSKLVALSEANSNIQVGSEDELVYVYYRVTNLSKKTIEIENMFHLGDEQYHLFSNSGFHVEGLTPVTKVKYGETADFATALVGAKNSSLYFYDASLKGARCWEKIPTS